MFTFTNFKDKVREVYGANSTEYNHVASMAYDKEIEASCIKHIQNIGSGEFKYLLSLYPETTSNIYIDRTLTDIRKQGRESTTV